MIAIDDNLQDLKDFDNYIALGNFDGLHLGHLSLIYKIVELAKSNNGKSVVFTFKNHPKSFINKADSIKVLMSNEKKLEVLKKCGVDIVCFKEFDEEFMKMPPKNFIEFLVSNYNVKGIVVGFNYRFGYKNLGDSTLLKELQEQYRYQLYVMEPCKYGDKIISSTRIRDAILSGEVLEANKMLSRPYSISGRVIHGRKIGRTIGFPTANLEINKSFVLPGIGVYYTNINVNNKIYKGITSIGSNPTVNGKELTVETYILDFNEDIYDHRIDVGFIQKIRDQKKFNGLEELKAQIKKDKYFAINYKGLSLII